MRESDVRPANRHARLDSMNKGVLVVSISSHQPAMRFWGCFLAWLTLIGCGSASSTQRRGESAASSKVLDVLGDSSKHDDKANRPRFAKNFWWKIQTAQSMARTWVIAHCEPEESPDAVTFTPHAPAAVWYGGDRIRPATPAPLESALEDAMQRALHERGRPGYERDARLDVAASELARLVPTTGRVPSRLADFVVQRRGLISPSPLVLIMWGPIFNIDAMVQQLRGELPSIIANSDLERVGIGSRERRDLGAGVVVLVFQADRVHIEPIPRAGAAGQTIPLRAQISAAYTDPRVEVAYELGDQQTLKHTAIAPNEIRADISCGGYRGRKQVRIVAHRDEQPSLLASFPLWCNTQPPSSIKLDIAGERAQQTGSSEAPEQYIAERINRERERCGLDRVTVHVGLGDVARMHSRGMLRTRRLGHTSADTRTPSERARTALVDAGAVHQFLARTYALHDVQSELMHHAEYRLALLSPTITHVGIGIARESGVAQPELFLTQLFVGVPDAVTVDQVRRVVATRMNEERSFTMDGQLALSAQRAAEALASGTQVDLVVDHTVYYLRRLKTEFRDTKIHVWNGIDISDFQPGSPLFEASYDHIGVGVARGSSSDRTRAGSFHLVIVLGRKPSATVD